MKKILKLLPFISTIVFVILGVEYGLWHPAWLVYISIPLLGALLHSKTLKDRVINTSPFISIIIFILLGYLNGSYHPAWLVFMWMPVSRLLFDAFKEKILGILLIGISVYIYIQEPNNPILYILLTVLLFAFGVLSFDIIVKLPKYIPFHKLILWISLIILYAYIGVEFGFWHPAWLIFLLIPMFEILSNQIKQKRIRLSPYIPFIATILFFIIGDYFQRYIYAWLVFLLIPIVSILEQKESSKINEKK